MDILLASPTKVSARYRIYKTKSGKVKDILDFANLIIPSTLNKLGTIELVHKLNVGVGTIVPTPMDTGLGNPIAGDYLLAFDSVRSNEVLDKVKTTFYYRAKIPTGIEINRITELGIFDSSGTLFSHALLKDEDGLAIITSKLADEELEIMYSVTFESDRQVNNAQTLLINGVEIDIHSFSSTNTTDMGRFDTASLIKGIHLSTNVNLTDEISPSNLLLPNFTINSNGTISINLEVDYFEQSQLTELVLATTLGWSKYTFEDPLTIKSGSKLNILLGLAYSSNNVFNDIPRDYKQTVTETLTTTQSLLLLDYSLG